MKKKNAACGQKLVKLVNPIFNIAIKSCYQKALNDGKLVERQQRYRCICHCKINEKVRRDKRSHLANGSHKREEQRDLDYDA